MPYPPKSISLVDEHLLDLRGRKTARALRYVHHGRDLPAGIDMAREAIGNGSALEKLRAWVTWQNARPEDSLSILERLLKQAP